MSLRNAFEELGLEITLRKILAAVSYARTPQDQLRVNIDNQPGISVFTGNNNASFNQATQTHVWHGPSSWNVVDARETARIASEQQWAISRQRWTIT